ncbi:MAG TPA: GspH/FimT family pseudopilin [Methylibium sp.]|uniref:pilus assembly FimT family protein n=1 Tax=Methylibium sp. TaxID=2067992 RepID=UPI002DBDBF41|nr:GspH/FimT family pseudopilin [Methylibium sp.]HEU4460940.1 GspH/FimT family pseudopilin [Methylibium sp.]
MRSVQRSMRGFTLVELMVTIAVFAILLMASAPSIGTWINNTRMRTVAQVLQDGVRLAQAEAVRRNRNVTFFLTNEQPALGAAAVANGVNWGIRTQPRLTGEAAEFIRGGALTDVAAGVAIAGPAALCFGGAGPQVAVPAQGCAVGATNYGITRTGADRQLRVTVAIGGQVRMCDPDKTVSAANPDGC